MVKFASIPEELKQLYLSWSSIASQFHSKTSKYENYFYGDVEDTDTPYSKAQLEMIRQTTGLEGTINRIYSVTSQAIAYLVRKKQSSRLVAIDNKYKNYAMVLDKIKQGIMIDSISQVIEKEVIKDMLISGMGIKTVTEPVNQYESIFPALFRYTHSSEVILDPNCTDPTLRKMKGMWISKEITLDEAKQLYDHKIKKINGMYGQQVTWEMLTNTLTQGTENRRGLENLLYSQSVRVREFYDKVYTVCYLIESEKLGIRRVFKENLYPDQHSLLKLAIREEPNIYVRQTTMLGEYVIDVTMKPITEYPCIVRFFEWGGKPYKSKGFVHNAIPIQKAYDSALHLLLLHGYVATIAKYKAPRNSIKQSELTEIEDNMLNPLKMFLYDPVIIGDKAYIPERELPGNLGNFYPQLLQIFTQGLYEITGMDPLLLGNTQDSSVETFSSLTKYETAAMQRIMVQYDNIGIAHQQEGNVLLEYMLSELKPEVAYVYLDSEGKTNETEISMKALKELKLARYKVYAVPYESMPTQRIAVSTELLKIAQTTNDPSERKIFIHHALKLQDIREVDSLLDEINEVNNLKQLAAQMEEQLKRQNELMKQTENRAIRAEYREKIYARLISALEKIAKEEANEILGSKIRQLEQELKEEKGRNNTKE